MSKVEMKIICEICKKKFKTFIFTEKLCPKCNKKYNTVKYTAKTIKELINWDEFNKKE